MLSSHFTPFYLSVLFTLVLGLFVFIEYYRIIQWIERWYLSFFKLKKLDSGRYFNVKSRNYVAFDLVHRRLRQARNILNYGIIPFLSLVPVLTLIATL